jgi:hypothetical protein
MRWLATALVVVATTAAASAGTGVHVEEDWTDAAFSDPGWFFMSPGGSLGPTNGRGPEVPNALVHPVNPDSHWGVAMLELPADTIQAGSDEALVLKFTCFSDVARNSLHHYKIELACLHKNESAEFGHDHAIEASQNFSTGGSSNQAQLLPSVENNEYGLGRNGVRYAHVDGAMNSTNLAEEYTSLVLFRPQGGSTNVEQFGTRLVDDYNIPEAMYTYDQIQVSMPRNEGSGTVFAPGTDSANAQKGMAYAHVGVTKRTDCNLDYGTDALDFMAWYRGQGGSATMLTGDVNNSGSTDASDLSLIESALGNAHDPAFDTIVSVLPDGGGGGGGGCNPDFVYDLTTGEMTVDTKGGSLLSWLIEGPEAASTAALPGGSWWQDYFRGKEQWADSGLGGVSGSAVDVATYAPGLSAGDFGIVTYLDDTLDTGGWTTVSVVPEPATLALLGLGGLALAAGRRRR